MGIYPGADVLLDCIGWTAAVYAASQVFSLHYGGFNLMAAAILCWSFGGDILGAIAVAHNRYPQYQFWLFLAFAAAFAIKSANVAPSFLLPDAHVEAPTAGSVYPCRRIVENGHRGFCVYLPLFLKCFCIAPWMLPLAVIVILYGAACLCSKDVKKLVHIPP